MSNDFKEFFPPGTPIVDTASDYSWTGLHSFNRDQYGWIMANAKASTDVTLQQMWAIDASDGNLVTMGINSAADNTARITTSARADGFGITVRNTADDDWQEWEFTRDGVLVMASSFRVSGTSRYRGNPEAFSCDQPTDNSSIDGMGPNYISWNHTGETGTGIHPAGNVGFLTKGRGLELRSRAATLPVYVVANDNEWVFGSSGGLTIPSTITCSTNGRMGSSAGGFILHASDAGSAIYVRPNGTNDITKQTIFNPNSAPTFPSSANMNDNTAVVKQHLDIAIDTILNAITAAVPTVNAATVKADITTALQNAVWSTDNEIDEVQ